MRERVVMNTGNMVILLEISRTFSSSNNKRKIFTILSILINSNKVFKHDTMIENDEDMYYFEVACLHMLQRVLWIHHLLEN